MKDVGQWLRDADPLGPASDNSDDAGLSPDDFEVFRHDHWVEF